MTCDRINRITEQCHCDYVTSLKVRFKLIGHLRDTWAITKSTDTPPRHYIHFYLPRISNKTVRSITGQIAATRAGGTKFDRYGNLLVLLEDCGGVYLVFEALKKAGYVS